MCIRGAKTVKKINLTTKLNLKIIGVVLLLMITVTVHNLWLSLQEENEKNALWLVSITDFLVKRKPEGSFSDIVANHGPFQSTQQEIMMINHELQPVLQSVLIPSNIIKFGFYSRQHDSIVALGPHSDISILLGIDAKPFKKTFNSDTERFIERKNSLVWHGANSLIHVKPVTDQNGNIIGHAFAAINQDAVNTAMWKRTANTLGAVFFMLLVCIVIFRELFNKLKKDMQLFAERILSGCTSNFNSELSEFTPILQYISDQTEKMTRLDRLNIIGEMAAGIAHEVRNPMTTVRGLLQFMGNKQEFAKQKEKFNLMIDEIDRANKIITEFLSLAKNKAMNFSEKNLNDIIRDIYPLIQADALRNNSDIKISLGDIPPLFLDQDSIHQLILNMVRNGLDAMPKGGLIHINTTKNEHKVILSIKDHGLGIPKEDIDKLGTPFYTTKDHGTGLGLAVCYRIVHRHAATLSISSEVGQGTIFTIEFETLSSQTLSSIKDTSVNTLKTR